MLEGRGLPAAILLCACVVLVDALSHPGWPRVWFAAALPIAVAVGCSVLPARFARPVSAGWSWPIDGGLALALGVGGTALWTHLMRWRLRGHLAASDFVDYCEILLDERTQVPRPESFAWLPGLFVEAHGIIGALTLSAWIGCALVIVGLYVWGRALHGRVAGVAVVAFASALTPVILLSRTITMYPQATAATVVACAGTAAIWRFRHPASSLVCGLALMACLLSQQRGFLVALPLVPVALLGSVLGRSRGSAAASVAALILPLVAAFSMHDAVYPERASAVVGQVYTAVYDGHVAAGLEPPSAKPTEFYDWMWGELFSRDIRPVFQELAEIQALVPSGGFTSREHDLLRTNEVHPWVLLSAAALLMVTLRLAWRRRFVSLGLLVVTAGPMLLALKSAYEILPRTRFLTAGMCAVALVLGLAFALVVAPDEDRTRRVDLRSAVRALVGIGLLIACVSGLTSTWLGPHAEWRQVILPGFSEPARTIRAASTSSRDPCTRALGQDEERLGRVMPEWVEAWTPVDVGR